MLKEKKRAKLILRKLENSYPRSKISLKYSTPWELLVAVILSAQCKDKQVVIVTDSLFKKYRSIHDYANANPNIFQEDIRSTGFYKNKTKNIIKSANIILKKFKGKFPDTMQDLLKLSGVGRKTANVILYEIFEKNEGIAVDTHVKRLSFRLGLTRQKDPKKIEKDLMKIFNKNYWGRITILLIAHGRFVCKAKNPKCSLCFLNKICPSAFNF